jgi:ADP-L-glycero-D-manno-heptose 6-epimerase
VGTIDNGYILVTGGAGFIGSAVVKELNRRGYTRIVIVDDLGTGPKWLNLVQKQYSDLLHKSMLFPWLEAHYSDISGIIHLGACSNTVELDANYLLENNYRFSRILADFAITRSLRFVYASSAATYGNGTKGFLDDHALLETLQPLNMYGYSKHMFDLWLKSENLLNKVVGLKYFNVYGPNEGHKDRMASAVLRMVPEVLETSKIKLFRSVNPLYADGEQKRDFIYVKDAAEVTCDFFEGTINGIFNVGTGEACSWNRLARAVFSALKKPELIEYVDMPKDLLGKYQYFTQADVTKTENFLNRKIRCQSLEQSVSDYVTNHLIGEKRW